MDFSFVNFSYTHFFKTFISEVRNAYKYWCTIRFADAGLSSKNV